MFNRLLKKLLNAVFDKPLPLPSSQEKVLISELQKDIRELPVSETKEILPSEAEWLNNISLLKELILSHDPREFLRWNVISNTMFVDNAHYITTELKYLKHRHDWNIRWRNAIKECTVGHPIPYAFYPSSSGNLIHHAYHMAQFEEKTNVQVNSMDYVLEFGGGYGSLCRLIYNLGFHGSYVIFDFPAISALQRYYLQSCGFPIQSVTEYMDTKTGIVCISEPDQLKLILPEPSDEKNTMFIATWSISESPSSMREMILPLVNEFGSFFIAYQDRFGEVNNVDYFNNWKYSNRKAIWHNWPIEHIPGNHYLVGTTVP